MATWYSDPDNIRGLGVALVNAEVLEDANDFLAFLAKPRQYDDHYVAWSEAGFPQDETDNGWEDFVEAVSSDESDDDDTEA